MLALISVHLYFLNYNKFNSASSNYKFIQIHDRVVEPIQYQLQLFKLNANPF